MLFKCLKLNIPTIKFVYHVLLLLFGFLMIFFLGLMYPFNIIESIFSKSPFTLSKNSSHVNFSFFVISLLFKKNYIGHPTPICSSSICENKASSSRNRVFGQLASFSFDSRAPPLKALNDHKLVLFFNFSVLVAKFVADYKFVKKLVFQFALK